tara:strand:+ start:623 stop:1174 length:552 start_codon:yes stop_codon:yes gene_type:complete
MITEKDLLDDKIETIRNFLTPQEAIDFWYLTNECTWNYGRVSNTYSNQKQKRMTHNMDPNFFVQTDLWKRCSDLFEDKISLSHAYINISDHATVNLPHSDGKDHGPSFLICLNQEWKKEWGGHTVMFKDMHSSDIMHAVSPEPGKATIFRGSIWHSGTPVAHFAEYPRFMLTIHCFLEKEINK